MEGVLKTMFLTKLKIATTIVVGMGLLGISWGLYPTRAAAPPEAKQEAFLQPPSEFAAEGKEGGNSQKGGQDEKKVRLPKGPAPAQVLVSLRKDGKLMVKADQIVATGVRVPPVRVRQAPVPMPGGPHPGPRILIKGIGGGLAMPLPQGPVELSYDLKEVQVFNTKGKEIGKNELEKLLKDETVAVASFGDQLPDPLHLRILKEGTLVFLLPLSLPDEMSLPDMPLPHAKQALFSEFGPATPEVLYFRKQPSNLRSSEQCLDLFDDIIGPWFFQVLP
jgi:hypothetical protein